MVQNSVSPIDTSYMVANDILFREVENEGILLHIASGTYYSLSETSVLFWQALSTQQPLEPVVNAIASEYDVTKEVIVADLESFLKDLSELGLITPAE